jgi:protein-S-isoprenylcysteine O-methyltransferase Ste14
MSLALRTLLFTLVIPATGGVYLPRLIQTREPSAPAATGWPGVALIAAGVGLYVSSVLSFAVVGRGTPGPWDAPRRVVAAGPYRWVRNPIYLAAFLIVGGEAWLFGSGALLAYTGALAVACHLLVIAYEEPSLRRRFGAAYEAYLRAVPRWVPRPP